MTIPRYRYSWTAQGSATIPSNNPFSGMTIYRCPERSQSCTVRVSVNEASEPWYFDARGLMTSSYSTHVGSMTCAYGTPPN